MRRPEIMESARTLLMCVQREFEHGDVLIVDGKPMELSEYTRDPDARTGRGAGRYAKGYKLHLILDERSRAVDAFDIHPLNIAETTTAAMLLDDPETLVPSGGLLLGDALFDSNPLHDAAHSRECQLVAPRKRPGTGLGSRPHHPDRIRSIKMTEGADRALWDEFLSTQRGKIERFFGTLVSASAGLNALPACVRRLHRVRLCVTFKLLINAARIALRRKYAA